MKKVALVTGGSRGLGAEIVRALAREGYDICFTYRQDNNAAADVSKDVVRMERSVIAIEADVRDFVLAGTVVSRTICELGGLHALVCNAGTAIGKPLLETTEEEWDTILDTCLKGTFNYIRAAAPIFQGQLYGKIICIGSINAQRARPNTASYNAAKAGIEGLVRTVATELGSFNVNANVVAPGFIETQAAYLPGRKEEILAECAIKRLGTSADIAPVVAFLASDAARHITGQVITVDAGQSLARALR